MRWSHQELPDAVAGLLGFPVTPFDAAGRVDETALRAQVAMLVTHGARALFPACGTGEMQSLSATEYRQVLRACLAEAAGAVPVLPGIGFGHSIAVEMLAAAQADGADGALVFPPYMHHKGAAGRHEYFASLAATSDLGLILYQRDSTIFTPDEVVALAGVPTIVGLKDGTGKVDLLVKQVDAVASSVETEFAFFNGAPTAELIAPAVQAIGITSYSSALLNFVPEIAGAFYRALTARDFQTVADLMATAIVPFVRLRDRAPGYAVSLVKAGVSLRGLDVGPVRAPLEQPSPDDLRDLHQYLEDLGLAHSLHPAPEPSGGTHDHVSPVRSDALTAATGGA